MRSFLDALSTFSWRFLFSASAFSSFCLTPLNLLRADTCIFDEKSLAADISDSEGAGTAHLIGLSERNWPPLQSGRLFGEDS